MMPSIDLLTIRTLNSWPILSYVLICYQWKFI